MPISVPAYLKRDRSFLWHFLHKHGLSITVASVAAILLGAVAATLAVLIGPSVQVLIKGDLQSPVDLDQLLGSNLAALAAPLLGQLQITGAQLLAYLPPLLLILGGLKFILLSTQVYLWERLSEAMARDIRSDIMAKFLAVDAKKRKRTAYQEMEASVASIVATDVKFLREYVVRFFGGLPRELIQVAFLSAALISLSPELFLLFLVAITPTLLIISRFGKKLQRRATAALDDFSLLSEWLQQRLLGMETIKHYHTEELERAKMQAFNSDLQKAFYRAARIKARTGPLLEFVGVTALAIVLVISFAKIQAQQLSGSIMMSFFTALAVLAQSGNTLGRYFNSSREGRAALSRIRSLLSFFHSRAEDNASTTVIKSPSDIAVVLRKVSVKYEKSANYALDKLSYTFFKGKIYGIEGPSGSGKSTLLRSILGCVAIEQGQLELAQEIKERGIGYVPQEPKLISGSLAYNVSYPAKEWKDADIDTALKKVKLFEAISKLPKTINTELDNHNPVLSGGQIQRLHLARLFYHDYPLILIDEGTSALDSANEKLLCRQLRDLAKETNTIILVSHRQQPLSYADTVVSLASISPTKAYARGRIDLERIGAPL